MLHRPALHVASAHPSRRGALGKGCLIGLGVVAVLLVILLIFGATLKGSYNGLAAGRENAQSKWAAIDSQYKRRYDLIPNLVATVKGAADFEKSTLEAVTEARASVGRAQLPSTLPTDPAQLNAYIAAQQNLGGALSRLLVVSEQYPQLRATEAFRGLQDELAGTENRIQVARRDYIESVREYNTRLATFPGNVIGGMFGFQRLAQIEIAPSEREVPKVDFGTSK